MKHSLQLVLHHFRIYPVRQLRNYRYGSIRAPRVNPFCPFHSSARPPTRCLELGLYVDVIPDIVKRPFPVPIDKACTPRPLSAIISWPVKYLALFDCKNVVLLPLFRLLYSGLFAVGYNTNNEGDTQLNRWCDWSEFPLYYLYTSNCLQN